jgi:predicted RNA-binding Zn-ribbon protein involved in translation (DUF1610 family)
MGELSIRKLTSADELWVCDDCGQEGIRANGREIHSNQEMVMWLCFNCVQKTIGK